MYIKIVFLTPQVSTETPTSPILQWYLSGSKPQQPDKDIQLEGLRLSSIKVDWITTKQRPHIIYIYFFKVV
jgi:hypothetical protein